MKIEELKPCLYFNIKPKDLDKLYLDEAYDYRILDENWYEDNFYTAIKMGDDWYMVNDSDFPLSNCRTIEEYIEYIKNNQYEIYHYIREYSYKPEIKLNQKKLNKFKLAFDLEECEVVNYGEERDYKIEDVIRAGLFNRDNFPYYVVLIKKGTQKDERYIQGRILDDLSNTLRPPSYNETELKRALIKFDELDDKNEELIEDLKTYAERIKKCQEEIYNIDLKWLDVRTGRIRQDKEEEFYDKEVSGPFG